MNLAKGRTLERKKRKGLCAVYRCRKKAAPGKSTCYRCAKRQWRERHPVKAAFRALQDHAKERGLPVTITLAQFAALVGNIDLDKDRRRTVQIDRIDATRGYEPGNLKVLTVSENVAKGNQERHCPRYQEALKKRQEQEAEESAFFMQEWYG